MHMGIAGKRALVTGGGRGIGRSIAACLAGEGVKVAVVSRTESDVESVVAEMGGSSLGHLAIPMDMMPEGAPGRLLDLLPRSGFWPVDIAVHNLGGTLDVTDPFCSVADWRRVWRLNLEVALELNSGLLPSMRTRRWGRAILVSSISGLENHGPVPYCCVKAAVTAYARSMGRVLAKDGVVVAAVLPGAVLTEDGYWDQASRERPEQVKKYLEERMAIQRFGRVEEIGHVVTFLCSEHASFCTGSVVPVDGGQGRSYFGL